MGEALARQVRHWNGRAEFVRAFPSGLRGARWATRCAGIAAAQRPRGGGRAALKGKSRAAAVTVHSSAESFSMHRERHDGVMVGEGRAIAHDG